MIAPSASYSFTVRLQIASRPGMLGRVASAIGDAGGDIGAVDLVETTRERTERDITVKARDSVHAQQIVARLRRVAGIRVGVRTLEFADPDTGTNERDADTGNDACFDCRSRRVQRIFESASRSGTIASAPSH